VLFEPGDVQQRLPSLTALYESCRALLEMIVRLDSSDGGILAYCSSYIVQMIEATSFTLLRLLNSSFGKHIDEDAGKKLFNTAVTFIKKLSVSNNDLPGRLAEVLAQLWRGTSSPISPHQDDERAGEFSLEISTRMSMSIIYDSLLKWRREFVVRRTGAQNSKCPFLC
jgi:hypothetical protein